MFCIKSDNIERHVHGFESMYLKYKEELVFIKPEVFTITKDETLKNDFLSTTSAFHPMIKHFTFGPVTEDSFGVFNSLLK